MDCPRCGFADADGPSCPRCGVFFAKLQARRPLQRLPREPHSRGSLWLWAGAAFVVLIVGLLLLRGRRDGPRMLSTPTPAPVLAASSAEPSAEAPPPTLAVAEPPPTLPSRPEGLSDEEIRSLDGLAVRLRSAPSAIGPEDLRSVEAIYARHPELEAVKPFLEATLVRVALALRRAGRTVEAEAHLRRACALSPSSLPPRIALLDLLLDGRDWTAAETLAREVLAITPADAEVLDRLGFALFRQDRSREAAEALRQSLGIRESASARALLQRIEKGLGDEAGMTEQRLSHFNVRYDGEAHEDVGREVLRALERHYATLATVLDYEPRATVPVILFSREAYYDASGAPRWSGGVYDNLDGRVRVPIGGLDAGLGPEMDGTLIHELTHAFAAEITGGLTPSDVNEGLAQYMEGKRLSGMLRAEELQALADGRIGGVAGTYLNALSFVEYLIGLRGQGGVNDLLRAMGETHNVDEAFRQVYGGSAQQTRLAWRARLRQQHGS